ncbi:MAG: hypothetical protein V7637_2800, partial [Mycobacteriales bacterium]
HPATQSNLYSEIPAVESPALDAVLATAPAAVVAYVADTGEQARRVLRRELPRWLGPGPAGYRRADGQPHPVRDPQAYAESDVRARDHSPGRRRRIRRRHPGETTTVAVRVGGGIVRVEVTDQRLRGTGTSPCRR